MTATKLMAAALQTELRRRGIELHGEDCETIIAGVIERAGTAALSSNTPVTQAIAAESGQVIAYTDNTGRLISGHHRILAAFEVGLKLFFKRGDTLTPIAGFTTDHDERTVTFH
jgi:hypothetical protein